jgi:hypothetical protein
MSERWIFICTLFPTSLVCPKIERIIFCIHYLLLGQKMVYFLERVKVEIDMIHNISFGASYLIRTYKKNPDTSHVY